MKYQIEVKSSFCAAHALSNYGGDCKYLHGHNFDVVVRIESKYLNQSNDMVMDFKVVKKALKSILSSWDHGVLLNEKEDHEYMEHLQPLFERCVLFETEPTCERLAGQILGKLQVSLFDDGLFGAPEYIKVASVTVSETSSYSATVFADSDDE